MAHLGLFTRVSQWYHVFLTHAELSCANWNEVSSLLRDIKRGERTSDAGISLCKDRTACLS